jgi:hypothetical protein
MNAPIDLAVLKSRQQAAWASGNYALIGTTLQLVGEQLAEACDLRWDERVLDVAAGNGNATLASARRGARVPRPTTSPACSRPAPRALAPAARGDVRDRRRRGAPYADASFDAVVSTFGVMFAPDHARRQKWRASAAGVAASAGQLDPDGFIGQLFKTLGRHLPPPADAQPPALWGSEAHLRSLFGEKARASTSRAACSISAIARRPTSSRLPHLVRAGAQGVLALPPDQGQALADDLTKLIDGMNRAGGLARRSSEYLEIVITRG